MELVDPNLPPTSTSLSYPAYCADIGRSAAGVPADNLADNLADTGIAYENYKHLFLLLI